MLDAVPSPAAPVRHPETLLGEIRLGLTEQSRVVRALILRETRARFGKHQLGYLWAFLEPLFFIGTFYLIYLIAQRRLPPEMDIISFITTGLLPFQVFRNIAQKTMNATGGNKPLLTYPKVKPFDLVIARFCLEAATFTTIFVVLLGVSTYVAPPGRRIDDVLTILMGLGLAIGFGGAVGVTFGGISLLAPAFERIQSVIMRPLFWISGVFFTANQLPSWARDYLLWNPILHAVEIIRDGFFPSYTAHYANPMYTAMWVLLLGAAGLHLQRFALKRDDT